MTTPSVFVRGNGKLGPGVWTFDLPAVSTCPGSTPTCRKACYARRGNYGWRTVQARQHANERLTRLPAKDFVRTLLGLIDAHGIAVVRVHTSGDFKSVAYCRAWLRVARARPETRFFFYTRSWRRRGFPPVLAAFAALPNAHVWFSCDRDTGPPRRPPPGVRLAWLVTAADEPAPGVVPDLVFRTANLRDTPAAVWYGGPVCPTETGLPGAHDVTCTACGKCFGGPAEVTKAAPGRKTLPVVA